MALEIEGLLIALAFLLPGFLTSRLIAARTPAAAQESSALEETLDSLLRSVSIHLIIAPIVLVIVRVLLIGNDPPLLSRIHSEGLQAYYDALPVQVLFVLFGWLVAAFLFALFFGYKWDPIESLLQRLATRTDTLSVDHFYLVKRHLEQRREQGQEHCAIWVQARLKNGYTYRGEPMAVAYRE